jgi:prepilin-type processing-associated H-X9-DG protein
LLLPAVQAAREAARRMQCTNNLKQIGIAMHNYLDRSKTFPNGTLVHFGGATTPQCSATPWSVAILPFIEQASIAGKYDSTYPATSTDFWGWSGAQLAICALNASYGSTVIETYVCPSAPDAKGRTITGAATGADLGTFGGAMALFAALYSMHALDDSASRFGGGAAYTGANAQYLPPGEALMALPAQATVSNPNVAALTDGIKASARLEDMTDGSSNTILLSERIGGPDVYVKGGKKFDLSPLSITPEVYAVIGGGGWVNPFAGTSSLDGSPYVVTTANILDGGPCAINCCSAAYKGMFSMHPGGANVAMADGSSRFVSESTAPFIIGSMFTRSNREVYELP